MKKIYISLCLSLAISSLALAQDKAVQAPVKTDIDVTKVSQAEIKFDYEEHDFGTLEYGGNGVYEFKFKNTGSEPLIITNAVGSCGCTVPTFSREPIKPYATGSIKVSYDTKRPGPISKTVSVTSNAKTPQKTLLIKGNVLPQAAQAETNPLKKQPTTTSPVRVN